MPEPAALVLATLVIDRCQKCPCDVNVDSLPVQLHGLSFLIQIMVPLVDWILLFDKFIGISGAPLLIYFSLGRAAPRDDVALSGLPR